jgi:GntR family transcriptional repressor for pyruvate dehydrogenase complex
VANTLRLPSSRPAPSPTLAAGIADAIRGRIVRGELAPGTRLPPERVLVDEFGASRAIVREALSTLEALGMVESRSTRGRFVTDGGSGRSRSLVDAWLHSHASELAELDEIRALVEGHLVAALTQRQAADAARKAAPLLSEQDAAVARGDAAVAAACDRAFHVLLCSYTGNAALSGLALSMIENARTAALAVYSLPDQARRSLGQHRRIVDALAARHPELASELARRHMLDVARRYEKAIADATADAS